jgi:hypothetical protein
MAALNESVAKAKASRSDGGDADVHEMPTKRTANREEAGQESPGEEDGP